MRTFQFFGSSGTQASRRLKLQGVGGRGAGRNLTHGHVEIHGHMSHDSLKGGDIFQGTPVAWNISVLLAFPKCRPCRAWWIFTTASGPGPTPSPLDTHPGARASWIATSDLRTPDTLPRVRSAAVRLGSSQGAGAIGAVETLLLQ